MMDSYFISSAYALPHDHAFPFGPLTITTWSSESTALHQCRTVLVLLILTGRRTCQAESRVHFELTETPVRTLKCHNTRQSVVLTLDALDGIDARKPKGNATVTVTVTSRGDMFASKFINDFYQRQLKMAST